MTSLPRRPGSRESRLRPATLVVSSVFALTILAVLCAGWLTGWRTHTMTTPSMGRSGQVGSVVVSRPVSARQIHLGDVLVFHPPNRPNVTFVHRVISVTRTAAGPRFNTKGDINGAPDPWTLSGSTIIGRVVLHIPGAGYLLQMLPLLFGGVFILLLLTQNRTATRAPDWILGGSVLAASLLVIYRPLVRLDLIGQVRSGSQGHAAMVPTGVLPVRITAWHGSHADLTPGQVGSVVSHLSQHGTFRVDASVHLQGWWWLLLASWGIPLVIAISCCRHRVSATNPAFTGAVPRLIPRPAPGAFNRDVAQTRCRQGRHANSRSGHYADHHSSRSSSHG